jgi:hypothetical protein
MKRMTERLRENNERLSKKVRERETNIDRN